MAKERSQKAVEKGGKIKRKHKRTSKKYKNYTISGDKLIRKNTACPKCGAGVFMAEHKDRKTCGKCGYMEVRKSN